MYHYARLGNRKTEFMVRVYIGKYIQKTPKKVDINENNNRYDQIEHTRKRIDFTNKLQARTLKNTEIASLALTAEVPPK